MKKVILFSLFIIHYSIIHSQNVGIGTTTPKARLHVADSNVLFSATGSSLPASPAPPPTTGGGRRLMWYADKAAFRVGTVTGDGWDRIDVGNYSMAMGFNTKAVGTNSTAIGHGTTASGTNSTALGEFTNANGYASTAIGNQSQANGKNAIATGFNTYANGFSSLAVGMYNDSILLREQAVTPATPLFIIGNGDGPGHLRNALTVLKSGNVGIGTNSPVTPLQIRNGGVAGYAPTSGSLVIGGEAGPNLVFDNRSILARNNGTPASLRLQVPDGNVGIGPASPDASAALDITSTNKGLLIPRLTTAQRKAIVNPATGLMVFDTDKNTVFMFEATKWVPFIYASGVDAVPPRKINSTLFGNFGFSADMDSSHAIVGAPTFKVSNIEYGGVQFFDNLSGYWQSNGTITAPNLSAGANFGYSVAIDGDIAVIGAPKADVGASNNEGKVFVYKRNTATNNWALLVELTGGNAGANDNFGTSVDISGSLIIIGAPGDDIGISGTSYADQGSAYVFAFNGSTFTQRAKLYTDVGYSGDAFGASVGIEDTPTGDFIIIGAPNHNVSGRADQGVAYIFVSANTPASWIQSGGELVAESATAAAGDKYGSRVAVKNTKFAVLAPSTNNVNDWAMVYIYAANHNRLFSHGLIKTADLPHVYSLSFNGEYIAVGINNFAAGGITNSGYVTVLGVDYNRDVKDLDPVIDGGFGYGVALWGFNLLTIKKYGTSAQFLNIE
jgi:hypothetical protein